jgi:hypothetical protein
MFGGILESSQHPMVTQPLPSFISAPGGADYLLIATGIFLVLSVMAVGLLYLRLHALPDHIAHKWQKIQFEIVCVLGLLAMFTHVHAFWIAALLLALIDIPDFSTPLGRIADAIGKIAGSRPRRMAAGGVDAAQGKAGEESLPQPVARASGAIESTARQPAGHTGSGPAREHERAPNN